MKLFLQLAAFYLLSWAAGLGASASTPTIRAGTVQMASPAIARTTYRTEEGATVGADIVVNGSFSTDSDWTKPTGGTISGGKATWTQNGFLSQSTSLDAGAYYECIYKVSDYTHGAIRAQLWNDYSANRYCDGVFREIIHFSGGTGEIDIYWSDTASGSVSNITVRKITPAVVNYNPRRIAITGDSIAQHTAVQFPDSFPGNTASGFSLASSGITPVDCALGNQTFNWVRTNGIIQATSTNAATIIILCGCNDVSVGRTWSNVLSDLAEIRTLVTTQDLFISEILPDGAADDSQSATIRSWNTNLAAWCATNSAQIITCHDRMGQIRISTGQLDDLRTAYVGTGVDKTHPNSGGEYVLWSVWCAALETFYGVPVK